MICEEMEGRSMLAGLMSLLDLLLIRSGKRDLLNKIESNLLFLIRMRISKGPW